MAKKKKDKEKNKKANEVAKKATNSSGQSELEKLQAKKQALVAAGKDTANIQAKIKTLKQSGNSTTEAEDEPFSEDKYIDDAARGLQDTLGATNRLGLTGEAEQIDMSELDALMDPNSPSYIGRRSNEDKNTLEALERQVQVAGNRSKEMSNLLGLFESGLAGLNAQENQAIREQSQREVNREYETGLYELRKAQSRNRTRGGAASRQVADLSRDRMKTQKELEQDLLIKNIDIQDQRRQQYGDTLGREEQNEFLRTNQSLRDYTDASGNIQNREDNRLLTTRQQRLGGQQFNVEERNRNKAANLAAATGLYGLGLTEKNNDRTYKLTKEGMQSNERIANRQAAAAGSGGTSINPIIQIGEDAYKDKYGEDPNYGV